MSRLRIAHLSDPHFGTVLESVEVALGEALAELQPNLVLISGDITQRARRAQFKQAAHFKAKLGVPSFAVPGNHDIPLFNIFGRLIAPYANFHKYFQAKRETEMRLGEVRVLGLNSTSRWRHVQGSLDEERVRAFTKRDQPKALVTIAMVHHPLDVAKGVDEKNLLKGAERTLSLFEELKVDLVLSGHVHDPYVVLSNHRYPNVKHPMILSVAGTCLSWRTRKGAPNSFNLIEIETEGSESARIGVTRHDLAANRFSPASDGKLIFRRDQGIWLRSV